MNGDVAVLRTAAELISSSSDAWAMVSEYFTDRDLDVDADDVCRCLQIAADQLVTYP